MTQDSKHAARKESFTKTVHEGGRRGRSHHPARRDALLSVRPELCARENSWLVMEAGDPLSVPCPAETWMPQCRPVWAS